MCYMAQILQCIGNTYVKTIVMWYERGSEIVPEPYQMDQKTVTTRLFGFGAYNYRFHQIDIYRNNCANKTLISSCTRNVHFPRAVGVHGSS